MGTAEYPWLVKSSGRIRGPFTKSQVEQLLKTREFVPLDEVSQPFSRWQTIRDVGDFAKIVEEIRLGSLKYSEDTISSTLDSTGTMTLTENINEQYIDERTDDFSHFSNNLDEIVYESNEINEVRSNSPNHNNLKTFGLENETLLNEQSKVTSKIAWILLSLGILSGVAFISYQRFFLEPLNKKNTYQQLKQSAIDILFEGNYLAALSQFEKVYSINPNDKEIYVYLGTLRIQIASQTVEGKRVLKDVIEHGSGIFPKLALAGIGIADFIDGNLVDARKAFLSILSDDPKYIPAKINLSVIDLTENYPEKALERLEEVINDKTVDGAAFLTAAESLIQLFQKSKDARYLQRGKLILRHLIDNKLDYYQESLLLTTLINRLEGQSKNSSKEEIDSILDIDPELTSDFRHDLFIIRERLQWKNFVNYCNKLSTFYNMDFNVRILKAYCSLKSGNQSDALKWSNDAVTQESQDSLLQSIYSYILDQSGQETRASVALGKSNDLNRKGKYDLPMILQGKFYLKANRPEFAQKQFFELVNKNSKNIVGLGGLAKSYFLMDSESEMQLNMNRVFSLTKDYKPILKLKREAENSGMLPKNNM